MHSMRLGTAVYWTTTASFSLPCIVFLMMALHTIPPCASMPIHHNRNSNIIDIYMISKYFLCSVIAFSLFHPPVSIRFFRTPPSLHPSSQIPTASSGTPLIIPDICRIITRLRQNTTLVSGFSTVIPSMHQLPPKVITTREQKTGGDRVVSTSLRVVITSISSRVKLITLA